MLFLPQRYSRKLERGAQMREKVIFFFGKKNRRNEKEECDDGEKNKVEQRERLFPCFFFLFAITLSIPLIYSFFFLSWLNRILASQTIKKEDKTKEEEEEKGSKGIIVSHAHTS